MDILLSDIKSQFEAIKGSVNLAKRGYVDSYDEARALLLTLRKDIPKMRKTLKDEKKNCDELSDCPEDLKPLPLTRQTNECVYKVADIIMPLRRKKNIN